MSLKLTAYGQDWIATLDLLPCLIGRPIKVTLKLTADGRGSVGRLDPHPVWRPVKVTLELTVD